MKVKVSAPATTANLGAGFDCLALALDLWNEAEFDDSASSFRVQIEGEGKGSLPENEENLVVQAYLKTLQSKGVNPRPGLNIRMFNRIPTGSGLGSSASAVVLGIAAANTLHNLGLPTEGMIGLAAEMEGHGDNAAAAVLGGLVAVLQDEGGWLARRIEMASIHATVVLPDFSLPTRDAREALPKIIPHADAVYNISRSVLTVEALRTGDHSLLRRVMNDRLHEPYRLRLIPGAMQALEAARQAGAAAALSGAGPALIAFHPAPGRNLARLMEIPFQEAGLSFRSYQLTPVMRGTQITG